MGQTQEKISIAAGPDEVWKVAGDPGIISEWLPAIAHSEADDDQRACTTVDGTDLKERIVERNDAERYYVYEITGSPMPISSYRSVLSVEGADGQSHVAWSADIEPAGDASAEELEKAFSQIYRDGLENLRKRVQGD